MAISKRPEYKRVGQVGHFNIALHQTRGQGNVVTKSEVVIIRGKSLVESGFKNVAAARERATELLKEFKKLRKK